MSKNPTIKESELKEALPKRIVKPIVYFKKTYKTDLSNLMANLEALNALGVINTLSVQQHIISTSYEYTYVSFKIPKDTILKPLKRRPY